MSKQVLSPFAGFTPACYDFLLQLSLNNDKVWFENHRDAYKRYVQTPLLALEQEWGASMRALDPSIRTGRYAVSRIHRDTRFSKDKSPYRDNAWIAYRPAETRITEYFGVYFEISPVSYAYGIGIYAPHPAMMEAFRKKAAANPAALMRIVEDPALRDKYTLHGEDYVRQKVPDAPDCLRPLLNKRSFHYAYENGDLTKTYARTLLDELNNALEEMRALYLFVNDLREK